MAEAYAIDPAWPVVRDERGDQYSDEEVETCERCFARAATVLGEIGGVEAWICGYCL